MRLHVQAAAVLALALCACGGSGDGGGGGGSTPVNLLTFQAATDIIGQSAATGGLANNGAAGTNPVGLSTANGHVGNGSVYVGDPSNNRLLCFDDVPTGLGPSGDFVVGQPDFTTGTAGTTATTMRFPSSCWVANGVLFVADTQNHRVLLFGPPPTATGAAATVALGQPNLTANAPGNGTSALSAPLDVCVAAGRIAVADFNNNRVMIWNGIPAVSGAAAQVVVGQPNFTTTSSGATASKLSSPRGVWTDGTRLVVADDLNNRVLIWNTFPTVNGQPADLVIGQPDFTTVSSGNGTLKMNAPASVCSDGVSLFVADAMNHRVLVYSPFPTASNPAAMAVLGQSLFTNVTPNDDDQDGIQDATPSARTMNQPRGVTTIGNQLFVSDSNNRRVLIFTGS
jgi:hypothetical protein